MKEYAKSLKYLMESYVLGKENEIQDDLEEDVILQLQLFKTKKSWIIQFIWKNTRHKIEFLKLQF